MRTYFDFDSAKLSPQDEATTELAVFAAERVDRPLFGRHAARIARRARLWHQDRRDDGARATPPGITVAELHEEHALLNVDPSANTLALGDPVELLVGYCGGTVTSTIGTSSSKTTTSLTCGRSSPAGRPPLIRPLGALRRREHRMSDDCENSPAYDARSPESRVGRSRTPLPESPSRSSRCSRSRSRARDRRSSGVGSSSGCL
jgi:hypothetical protein